MIGRKLTLPLLLACLIPYAGTQADDAYLDALQSEAQDLEIDSRTERRDKADLGNRLLPNLDVVEFEAALDAHFPVTFNFYRKLTLAQREAVYRDYLQDPDIERMREQITDFYMQ